MGAASRREIERIHDDGALRLGRVFVALPAGRRRPEHGGEHNTDAVKTTALGGVGTFAAGQYGCYRCDSLQNLNTPKATPAARSFRDRCRPRCYGLLIRQRWSYAPTASRMLRPLPMPPVPFRTLPNWNSA